MTAVIRRFPGLLIALIALALSAGLAFGAQPPAAASPGLSNAAAHAGKTVPVRAVKHVETDEDVVVDDVIDATGTEVPGENCTTDPTLLTPEEVAAMSHGSLVCWAAHQTTWPEEFKNHGAWVSSWAHFGKDAANAEKAALKAEKTAARADRAAAKAAAGKGKGHAKHV